MRWVVCGAHAMKCNSGEFTQPAKNGWRKSRDDGRWGGRSRGRCKATTASVSRGAPKNITPLTTHTTAQRSIIKHCQNSSACVSTLAISENKYLYPIVLTIFSYSYFLVGHIRVLLLVFDTETGRAAHRRQKKKKTKSLFIFHH